MQLFEYDDRKKHIVVVKCEWDPIPGDFVKNLKNLIMGSVALNDNNGIFLAYFLVIRYKQ